MNSRLVVLTLLLVTVLACSLAFVPAFTSAQSPSIALSQSKVTAGQGVLYVTGTGFHPGANVTLNLYINNTELSQPTWRVTANSTGGFVAAIGVPNYLSSGSYHVNAVDAFGDRASAALSVAAASSSSSAFSAIYLVISYGLFFVLIFLQPQLQSLIYRSSVERAVRTLNAIEKDSVDVVKTAAMQGGASAQTVDMQLQQSLETFLIEPVDRDPSGVLSRLDHILDIRNIRSKQDAKKIAPSYSGAQLSDFEVSLEAAWATHYINKIVRHFYLMAKKTNNFYLYLQLSMIVPQILEIARVYKRATKQFLLGVPVGDSIGPMVALNLMKGAPFQDIEEETEYGETDMEGRRLLVVKAKGPGATVGKPGKAIAKLVEMNAGKVSQIITVDAALKLEGEKTGLVAEGVGAAIGDPGPEKFAIEESGTKYNVPLQAIIVKQSEEEAITVMKKDIADSIPSVLESLKRILLERTKVGDTVIVAGIGNTAGVP